MRTYELVMILQPGLEEEDLDTAVDSFKQIVVLNGGEIVRVESMGRRRLAYQIQRHGEGHYVLMYLNLEQPTILELERRLKLSDDVLRHLLVRLDEEMTPEPEAVQEMEEIAAAAPEPSEEDDEAEAPIEAEAPAEAAVAAEAEVAGDEREFEIEDQTEEEVS